MQRTYRQNDREYLDFKDSFYAQFQDGLIRATISSCQNAIEKCRDHDYVDLDGLGNSDEQIGHYRGRVAQWYHGQRQKGLIKGSLYDLLSLSLSMHDNYTSAHSWYTIMIEKRPQCYQLYQGLANLEFNNQNYVEAKTNWNKVIQINHSFAPAYHQLALLHLRLGLKIEALQYANKALLINQENMYARLVKALCQENIEKRICQLSVLIIKYPDYTRIRYELGAAFQKIGEIQEAKGQFEICIAQDPNFHLPILKQGKFFKINGELKVAIRLFQLALKADNINGEAFQELGKIYEQKKFYKKAILYYSKGINVSPNNYECNYRLGKIYSKQVLDLEKMTNHFTQCIKISPLKYEPYQDLLTYYSSLNSKTDLIEILRKIVLAFPDKLPEHLRLAKILFEKRKWTEALKYYQICLNFYPREQQVLYESAICCQNLNLKEKCLKYLDEVIEMNPKDVCLLRKVGEFSEQNNLFLLAFDIYKRCQQIEQENPFYNVKLALLSEKLNHPIESIIQFYQTALSIFEKGGLQKNSDCQFVTNLLEQYEGKSGKWIKLAIFGKQPLRNKYKRIHKRKVFEEIFIKEFEENNVNFLNNFIPQLISI